MTQAPGRGHDVVLLLGRERLLKEEIVDGIVKKHIRSATARSFDLTVLRGGESGLADALDAASTLPVASDRRVVVVLGFDEMSGAKELFARYPVPSDSSVLVLCSGEGEYFFTLDKAYQRKFTETYGPRGLVRNFYAMKTTEVRDWVLERLRSEGRSIDPEAVSYMLEKTGESLTDLRNEIAKLLAFNSGTARLGLDDVRQVLSTEMDSSVERVRTCVVRKDTPGCLRNFRVITSRSGGKKEYLFLLADLVRYFRKLLTASVLIRERGLSRDQAAGMPEFGFKFYEAKNQFAEALSRFNHEELRRNLSLFYPMDRIVKSKGDEETEVYFERLLIALCGRGARLRKNLTS